MEHACSSDNNNYIRPRNFASKNPAVSALQDLLFFYITEIAFFVKSSSENKYVDETSDKITRLLYLTNKSINFDIKILMKAITDAYILKIREESLYGFLCKTKVLKPEIHNSFFELRQTETLSQMISLANVINVRKSIKSNNNINIFGIKELIRQSLASTSNLLEQIRREKKIPETIYENLYEILYFLGNEQATVTDCKNYCLKSGELHTQTIELLINTYEKNYGMIERKKVPANYKKGNAILVVGEDFKFLKTLLEKTEDKNINVYTYGVLNYAHTFSKINKYKNLAGIYTGKYNNIAADIESFPGIVILTAGNIENLNEIFRGRIYTTEDISMLGINKIESDNIETFIKAAYDAPGFKENKENCYIEIGFGLKELSEYTRKFYNLLYNNKIKKLVVFSGCHVFINNKEQLKNIIKTVPEKCGLITVNCIFPPYKLIQNNFKYVLNFGQFTNTYNLIRLLYGIAGKFRKGINDIQTDIVLTLSGTESISTLFMMLSLNVKNIKIYSDLPNYLINALIKIFEKEYNISKINNKNFNIDDDKKQA